MRRLFDTQPGKKAEFDNPCLLRVEIREPRQRRSPAADFGKTAFSFDGLQFYFSSNRLGGWGSNDLYVTTRERVRDRR